MTIIYDNTTRTLRDAMPGDLVRFSGGAIYEVLSIDKHYAKIVNIRNQDEPVTVSRDTANAFVVAEHQPVVALLWGNFPLALLTGEKKRGGSFYYQDEPPATYKNTKDVQVRIQLVDCELADAVLIRSVKRLEGSEPEQNDLPGLVPTESSRQAFTVL